MLQGQATNEQGFQSYFTQNDSSNMRISQKIISPKSKQIKIYFGSQISV